MPTFESQTTIRAPVDRVFVYATDPGNWREWYPNTSAVERAGHGPAQAGDAWVEHVTVAGMRLRIAWRTDVAERPSRWLIRGVVGSGLLLRPVVRGGVVQIEYTFRDEPPGTNFRRSITYAMPGLLGRVVGALVLDRKIEREVQPAIENLRRILER
ncbi:SRPBCC family protein [bacterium]|nr:SRPBCC family protein [bacterium]